jgi:antitoxin HigA-1
MTRNIEHGAVPTIKPTHPGEMLREDFLPDYGLTMAGLAEALGVSRQTINEVLREKRAISPVMALRLAQLFGNTPEFWLNAQRANDLWQAKRDYQAQIEKIKPLRATDLKPNNAVSKIAHRIE